MDVRIVKALQGGLPLTATPFKEIAEELGISEDELLSKIRAWQDNGIVRRFGAVLRHQSAGFAENAMGVWDVPDSHVDEFGRTAASRNAISHCYLRPRFEGFPYNIYTMIHGRSREECEEVARSLSSETGISCYRLLFTTAEYKKSPPTYFPDESG